MDRSYATHLTVGVCVVSLICISTRSVRAQSEPEQPPPPAAAEAAAPEAGPAPVVAIVAEVPAAAPPPTESELATAPEPTPKPDPSPTPLKLSSFMHLTNRVQNFAEPEKLNRFSQENLLFLIATGDVTERIGYQVAVAGAYGPISPDSGMMNGSFTLLDAIAKLDLDEAFHIWAGRMLVPSDRANFTGFWFMAPWYYPGGYYNAVSANNSYFGAPVGPRQGPIGRNDGATVWGQAAGGLFKYYVGVYDVFSSANNPLISGRVNLALINPEPGYFHSSVYYGKKDILALGASAQYQKSKGAADDYSEVSADLLFEKNTHGGGTVTLEAAFYKYFASAIDLSYYAALSYLTPEKLGFGYLQPLVRLQQAKPEGQDIWTIVEAQLGYIISDDAARLALGYQWQKAGGVKTNALYLGIQLMK